jgi:hypothetical protein
VSAEYKQVTVVFADVVHSMDIAAAVGAERLREIMTELVNRAGVVVALPRHRRQVHRRRHHGAVRGATSARGPRAAGMSGRAGYPGGGWPLGGRSSAAFAIGRPASQRS